MNNHLSIISARWVVPVEPPGDVMHDHSVVVENDKIIEICPTKEVPEKYAAAEQIELPHHALIPGLVNAHTHAAMSLFRGLADDISLMDWLNNHIWPAETKWVDPGFMRDGTELAIAEMLMGGTTCFNDMYFYPDIVAATAQESGIRAVVGMPVLDFPTVWAKTVDEYFAKGIAAHDEIKSLSAVETTMAPHAPYTVSRDTLKQALTYTDELQLHMHMHVHETADEIAGSMAQHGQRPMARLNDIGLLNPRLIAVHMVHLIDEEIELAAQTGVHVVHCPSSNQKLASGTCRVAELISAGVNVCLGTDSAASNNNLDMINEMRSAALIAKNMTADATTLPAASVLEMATINGAKALNLQDRTGSIRVGKYADLTAIDLHHVATQPVYDPVSQIVYSASRDQVSDVWVNGHRPLRNHKLSRLDIDHVLQKAALWGEKIANAGNP